MPWGYSGADCGHRILTESEYNSAVLALRVAGFKEIEIAGEECGQAMNAVRSVYRAKRNEIEVQFKADLALLDKQLKP